MYYNDPVIAGIEGVVTMRLRYPQIEVTKKEGTERFENADMKVRLLDYWSWAHSDLSSNAERGKFAEYLVAMAMNCADGVSEEWGSYDVHTPEDIKIEVKTSAYLQTWAQNELSAIRFSIKPFRAWDAATSSYDNEVKRQADVYVFCLENCREQNNLNPLDLTQWDFYPVLSATLNEAVGNQRTMGISALLNLGAKRCAYSELRRSILEMISNGKG
jgi:hypothetical protein